MKHSRTPWAIHPDGVIVAQNGAAVCTATDEDMRRIVACVNACEGIPTEAIEGRRINDIFTELTLEKNRLLEALNRILAFNLESDGATEEWVELVATIRNARNVVAEAEKTPTP